MSDSGACECARAAAGAAAEGASQQAVISSSAAADALAQCSPGAAAPPSADEPNAVAGAASEVAAGAAEAAAGAEAAEGAAKAPAPAAADAAQSLADATDGSMDVDAAPPAAAEDEEHARKRPRLSGSTAAAAAAQAAAPGAAAANADADAVAAEVPAGAAAAAAADGEGSVGGAGDSSTGTAAGAPGGHSSSSCGDGGGGAVADATSPEVAGAAAAAAAAADAGVAAAGANADDADDTAAAAADAAAAAAAAPAAGAAAAAAAAGGAGLDADAAAAAAIMQGCDGGPACTPGTPEFAAAAQAVDETLQTYDARVEQLRRAKQKKPDMIAFKELREELTPAAAHGHVPGVAVGRVFQGRGQMAILGLHNDIIRGIMARQGEPAYAIVLAGGYKDDADGGRVFWYTGAGGQESKAQVRDQSLSHPDNAAMVKNVEQSTPVRVFRGQKAANGGREYVYDGLYHVAAHRMEPSSDGPLVVRFKMVAVPGHSAVSATVTFKCLANSKFTQRVLAGPLPAGRKRGRKGEAHVVLLSAKEVAALTQQRAESGSFGRLVMADVSGGEEKLPIPVWNSVDDDDRLILPLGGDGSQAGGGASDEFTYISDYRYGEQAALDLATAGELAFNAGFTEKCGLRYHHPSPEHRDTAFYLTSGLLHLTHPCGVMECDEACEGRKCQRNRVVANGLRFPLELFKAPGGKGWGVRCSVDLQPGSVLCTYIGEVLTDTGAEELRGRDLYLFDLDHFHKLQEEEEAGAAGEQALPADQWRNPHMPGLPQELREQHLVVDARTQSNVARFINHSCEPNCTIQTVLSGNARSQLLFYIAIVAAQRIPAFTEITYDYGDTMAARFSCTCGAANCRGAAGAGAPAVGAEAQAADTKAAPGADPAQPL